MTRYMKNTKKAIVFMNVFKKILSNIIDKLNRLCYDIGVKYK